MLPYFTQFTAKKGIIYGIAVLYVFLTIIVVVYEPFMTLPCTSSPDEVLEFANPTYHIKCRNKRYLWLLGLTTDECSYGRRLVFAVVLGGFVGWERRQADRPAGIRTMSLVSLGSCLFTLCSVGAFMDGPNTWDASRVSAAIPSGVGFLGAGLIWKQHVEDEGTQVVHGLTTAASLWLSAAVGIASGGGMYFAASFTTAMMMVLLRFAPRVDDEAGNESHVYSSTGMVEYGTDMNGNPLIPDLKLSRVASHRKMGRSSSCVSLSA